MSLYRIDRFELPVVARDEFLVALRHTHELLHEQPGFDPTALMTRLGVTPEFGDYLPAVGLNPAA